MLIIHLMRHIRSSFFKLAQLQGKEVLCCHNSIVCLVNKTILLGQMFLCELTVIFRKLENPLCMPLRENHATGSNFFHFFLLDQKRMGGFLQHYSDGSWHQLSEHLVPTFPQLISQDVAPQIRKMDRQWLNV